MIFLSYSYIDVQLVRTISETLIGNFNKTWFAEYEIPIEAFLRLKEGELKEQISNGIDHADYAIFFTNFHWFDSPWCQFEYNYVINKKIPFLQICTDSKSAGKKLISENFYYKLENNDIEGLISFIGHKLGLLLFREKLILEAINYSPKLLLEFGNVTVTAQLGPYSQQQFSGPVTPYDFSDAGKRMFAGRRFGAEGVIDSKRSTLLLNLNPGNLNVSLFPQSYRIGSFDQMMKLRESDPEIRNSGRIDFIYYREFARVAQTSWYEAHKFKETGLHVCFFPNRSDLVGLTQMALTSVNKNKPDQQTWHRFYHFKIKDIVSGIVGEITLSCAVAINTSEDEQGFIEFCRLTPLFDSIAGSIRYHGGVNTGKSVWQ